MEYTHAMGIVRETGLLDFDNFLDFHRAVLLFLVIFFYRHMLHFSIAFACVFLLSHSQRYDVLCCNRI